LLVLSASAWLEVNSLRKQAHKEPAVEHPEAGPAAAAQAAVSYSDPFAAHVPGHAMAAAATAEAPPAASVAPPHVPSAVVEPELVADAAAASPALPSDAEGEQAIQKKAQRFARLLVDEIKLYNQAKVAEGRKNKDLYDRLKEAIEKSRATYAKRYGNTLAASGDYFQHELVRSLAEDDISIMGTNFRH
jgi:hypothetical protein